MTFNLDNAIPLPAIVLGAGVGTYAGQLAAYALGKPEKASEWGMRGGVYGGTIGLAAPILRYLTHTHGLLRVVR